MKSNKMPFINTQLKIVRVLLDGSKKHQREIAREIGRKESTISRALDYLVRDKVVCKEKLKTNSGGRKNKGLYDVKKCWLSYEVDKGIYILYFIKNLPEILLNDKSLLADLQKSNKIMYSLRCNFPFFKETVNNYGDLNDLGGMLYTESVNDVRSLFIFRCGLSQTFFKNGLRYESYLEAFLELYSAINENNNDCKKLTPHVIEQINEVMFLYAVITDKLNGNLNPNAIDEIRSSYHIHDIMKFNQY